MDRTLEFEAPEVMLLETELASFRAQFQAEGYVELQSCFAPSLIDDVRKAVHSALENAGRRRNLRMPVTGNSQRIYRLASREALMQASPLIPALYRSPQLMGALSHLTGEALTPVPYMPEEFVATRFEEVGDTHGWHWDDYAFALIWILEAPEREKGCTLEFIRNVPWDKQNPNIDHHIKTRTVESRNPARGSIYLLRTDTTMHRVTPMLDADLREMLCLSYAAPSDFSRAITHETIEALAR